MGECLNNTLREFKYAVVKPIKFYNKVKIFLNIQIYHIVNLELET